MSRDHLIQLLVDDFKDMFPNYSASEEALLRSKLSAFNEPELRLLISQTDAYKRSFPASRWTHRHSIVSVLLILSALIALYLNS